MKQSKKTFEIRDKSMNEKSRRLISEIYLEDFKLFKYSGQEA